jgi:lysophospholipase L1-like esterase
MLDAEGRPRPELLAADRLHFSPEGYKLLAERVRPYLPPADKFSVREGS